MIVDMLGTVIGTTGLLAFCAVVYAAAREGLALVGEHRASMAAAAALAAAAVLPELCGRIAQSIAVGALVVAALAVYPAVRFVRRRLRGPVYEARDSLFVANALIVVVMVLGCWCAWTTFLWDEGSTHFGVASLIARGELPPEQPYFPGAPFRYHIGYDVLAGLVQRATGARIDVACDFVTTACLAVLLWVARDAGRALGASKGAPSSSAALAVALVLFGYGPGAGCLAQGWLADVGRCDAWFPSTWVGATTMPPAVISNFFQHPQGLGMPIALAAIVVGTERMCTGRLAAAAVMTAFLAQAQTVFFALTGLALGVAVLATLAASRRRDTASIATAGVRLVILMGAGAAGFLLGGVLRGGGAVDAIRVGTGYFASDALPALLAHNMVLFGCAFVAPFVAIGLVVAARAPRAGAVDGSPLRLALASASLAGFAIADFAQYEHSWDIVKFFSAACFFGNALFAEQLARLCRAVARASHVGAPARVLAAIVAAVLLAASTWSASFWLVRHGVLNGIIAPVYAEQPPDPVGVVLWQMHRDDIGADARILTTHDDIAQLGFLVVGRDIRRGGTGYLLDAQRVTHEHDLKKRALPRLGEAELDALRVSFVFVNERDKSSLPALDDAARFEKVGGDVAGGDVVVNGAHWLLYRRRGVSP